MGLDILDIVSGTLPGDATRRVAIYIDDRRWAGVESREDGAGTRTYSCQLAPVETACTQRVDVRDTAGVVTYVSSNVDRVPRSNHSGLKASDVFALGHPPLLALPNVSFDGVTLRIDGSHMPPQGDPSSLSVRFGPGVAFRFTYELEPAPFWSAIYWYWPNANLSRLTIDIELPACTFGSDPFHFEFVETHDGVETVLSEQWVPHDLQSFASFTSDAAKIGRVQGGQDAFGIVLPGYAQYRYLSRQLKLHGIADEAATTLLDWGCGMGRLATHFARGWKQANVRGIDIDAANVAWCRESLGDRFEVTPLWPPSPLGDATIDGVFGVSVMTHLTARAQAAWIAELARIVRPGGIALLTFGGNAGTAFGSFWRDTEWWQRYLATGFDAETRDHVLDGFIPDDDYYRHTSQSAANVRATWSEHFDVLETIEAAFGNQDLAILRRRANAETATNASKTSALASEMPNPTSKETGRYR